MNTYTVRTHESYDGTSQIYSVEANSYTINARGLLEFFRRDVQTLATETIASYAPGAWATVVKSGGSNG